MEHYLSFLSVPLFAKICQVFPSGNFEKDFLKNTKQITLTSKLKRTIFSRNYFRLKLFIIAIWIYIWLFFGGDGGTKKTFGGEYI